MIMTWAMIAVANNEDYLESGSEIVSQVHDSLTIEAPDCKALPQIVDSIKNSMETCAIDEFGFTPVDVGIKYAKTPTSKGS